MIKRTAFFLFFGAIVLPGMGQTVLNGDNMTDAPAQYVYSIASQGPLTPPLSKNGQNTSWDYTDMDRLGQSIDSFFTVANTPLAYRTKFDNPLQPDYEADHAFHLPERASDSIQLPVEVEDRYNYYKETSTGYELLGFGARINGLPTSSKYDPKDRVYPFPLQYGATDSSYAQLTFDAISGFYYEQQRWRVDTVDGEGTLVTPYRTYNACLRVKTHLLIRDSLKSDSLGIDTAIYRPERIIYEWLTPADSVPVLRIVERGGVVNRVEYRDTLQSSSISTKNEGKDGVRVYPVPAQKRVHVRVPDPDKKRLQLWSMKGKRLQSRTIPSRTDRIQLDLRPYPAGVYMLLLEGKNGVIRKKLVKEE
ncbi:MAG: T9SS type A sorting domain-containing protein [Flavobacteriales bacterium]